MNEREILLTATTLSVINGAATMAILSILDQSWLMAGLPTVGGTATLTTIEYAATNVAVDEVLLYGALTWAFKNNSK